MYSQTILRASHSFMGNVDPRVDYAPMSNISSRLKEARANAGLGAQDAAKRAGVTRAAVYQWESGTTKPREDVLKKLSEIYGVRAEWLFLGSGPMVEKHSTSQTPSPMADNDLRSNLIVRVDAPPMFTSRLDLPVLGHTMAGMDGLFIDNGLVADTVFRPAELMNVPDGYAVEVQGTSMEPRLEQGWLLYVHPRKQPRPGKDVVIQYTDGRAIIKTLVKQNDTELTVREYSPERRDFKIRRADLKSIHLVVGIKP